MCATLRNQGRIKSGVEDDFREEVNTKQCDLCVQQELGIGVIA